HPERVSRLVLSGGYAQGWRARGNPAEIEGRKALLRLVRVGWGEDNPAFRQGFPSLMIPRRTLGQAARGHDLHAGATSPEHAARLLQVFGNIDVTQLLPRVAAPTLVLHSRGDAPCPFEQGLMLARGIPNARFVALESRNNVILSHEPAWQRFVDEVCAFLDENGGSISAHALVLSPSPPPLPPPRALRAFTRATTAHHIEPNVPRRQANRHDAHSFA